jgi:acetaldehyde dehydrogenase
VSVQQHRRKLTAAQNRVARVSAAIVGSGNIGTDLMYKLLRSEVIEPRYMVGIDPQSEGLRRAADAGLQVSADGVEWLLARPDPPTLVFEATSAKVHAANAGRYAAAGLPVVDLTPAAVGPYVVPTVNLSEHLSAGNVNLITCGGQATIPIVHAVARVTTVPYAEIVSSVASASAGPGTRANIDEFTLTTARGLQVVGGAQRGKAIVILNPAEPPLIMRATIFCSIGEDVEQETVISSVVDMVAAVQSYVPGYRLTTAPQFDKYPGQPGTRVGVFLEIEGAGDFLPRYSGNLDIMTAAAARVGELLAANLTARTK